MNHLLTFGLACVCVWLLSIVIFLENGTDNNWIVEKKFSHMCELNRDFVFRECFYKDKSSKCELALSLFEYDCNDDYNPPEYHTYTTNKWVQLFWVLVLISNTLLGVYNYTHWIDRVEDEELGKPLLEKLLDEEPDI